MFPFCRPSGGRRPAPFCVRVSPLLVYLIYSRLLYKFPSCRCCRARLPEFPLGIRGQDGNALRVSHGRSAPVCRCRCCYRLHLPGGGDGVRVGLRRSDGVWGCRGQVHLALLPGQGVIKQACYIIRDTEKWRKEKRKTIPEVPAVQKSDRGGTGFFYFRGKRHS